MVQNCIDIMENVDVENVCAEEAKKAGTADFIIAVENQRAIKVSSSTKFNFFSPNSTKWQ